MTLEDIKRKGMVSELVGRLSKVDDDLRKLLIKSPALPGARVYGNANQSIPDNTNTALIFTTADYDQAEFWDAGAPTRFTISIPGVYNIQGSVSFAANGAGTRGISVRLNNLTYLAWSLIPSTSTTVQFQFQISTNYQLVVGDYVEIVVWQNSTGALNSVAGGVNTPLGIIQRMS